MLGKTFISRNCSLVLVLVLPIIRQVRAVRDELRGIITKDNRECLCRTFLARYIRYAADMFDKKPGEAMAEATALMHTGKVNPTAQRIYDWTGSLDWGLLVTLTEQRVGNI